MAELQSLVTKRLAQHNIFCYREGFVCVFDAPALEIGAAFIAIRGELPVRVSSQYVSGLGSGERDLL